jgi:glucose/arabinose dehydrogenase
MSRPLVYTARALRVALLSGSVAAAAALMTGCSERTMLPDLADTGPRPRMVEPVVSVLPTVNIAPASRWPAGQAPIAAAGTQVTVFASGLNHPRWLHVLPNGDVLVAESNAPPREGGKNPLKEWVMGRVMARAGAGVPSANRITLLRDADGDGDPEVRTVFLDGLNSPFGMAFVDNRFYVANTDGVLEFAYRPGQTRLDGPGRTLVALPAGPINHHWTKSLIVSPDGRRLFATVGSNSNVAENGLDAELGRAAIWEIDRLTGAARVFASGLRNPNGMAWMASDAGGAPVLWTVVNERDEIGSDLVPDYLTSVRDGGFYGWPFSWYGTHLDRRVTPQDPVRVAQAVVPDFALGAHVAPLGLAANGNSPLGPLLAAGRSQAEGVFIGHHGSWNRRPHSGYKVVFLPFENGKPSGLPIDVLTGFLSPRGDAWGRPVGVAIDGRGALLVADDVGNTVWRVTVR